MPDEPKNQPPVENGEGGLPSTDERQENLPIEGQTDLDQAERSRLGRKFKKFEEDFGQVRQTISRLEQLLAQREEPTRGTGYDPYHPPTQQRYTQPDDDKPEFISTPEDLERYERWKMKRQSQFEQAYVGDYIRRIGSIGMVEQDKDLHSEVERELKTNVHKYLRHTNDPLRDADINYRIAKAEVLADRLAKVQSRPNVQGDRPSAPTGVTANAGRSQAPPPEKVQLDDAARKYVKALGLSEDDEWVQNSLRKK